MHDSVSPVTPDLAQPSAAWVRAYFSGVDTLEPSQVTRHFAGDGRFRFGNAGAAVGHEAITAMLQEFYSQLESMHHEETGLWLGEKSAVFEALANFVRKTDGKTISIPAVSVLRMNAEGLITDFRMTMDAAPLQN